MGNARDVIQGVSVNIIVVGPLSRCPSCLVDRVLLPVLIVSTALRLNITYNVIINYCDDKKGYNLL